MKCFLTFLMVSIGAAMARDTPVFTEINTYEYKGSTIEERRYPTGQVWACYDSETSSKDYTKEGFFPLYKYISGENDQEAKIEMTIPVSTKVKTVGDMNKMQTCFYLENKFQQNPPKPTNENVKIVARSEYTVFTRRVGGFMTTDTWRDERSFLEEFAQENGIEVEQNLIYINGYSSPRTIENRRNELWLVKA